DGTAALTGIPENRDVGISNVVLNVEDALGDNTNQNFTIEISNTNDPPVFTSAPITGAIQDVLYSYAIVTSDPDLGDSRTITPVTVPLWLNLTDNGNGTASLFGTPTNSNLGSNAIQIRVTDAAGASLDQSFVINVDNINDTPSFTSDPVTNAVEDLPYIYNINTSDPDLGDTREITLLSGPDWINLEDFGDGSGQLTGTPLNGDVGSATIVINVEDALGANVNQNFTIAIDNTNDPPKFTSNPISIALQDVLYSYNVTADDEDLADEIIVKATTLPGWLNFNDNGSGSATLEGTPTNSDLGLNDVTLVVEDAAGAAVEQIFQINVDNSNDPPFFTSTAPTSVNEDNVYTYNIVTDDPDFGDVGTITSLSKPEWLTLIDSGDGTGTLLGTPENQDVGTVSVVLNVADGIGANVNQNFSITVLNTNDAPLFTSTPRTGAIQDIFYQYNIVAADDDQGDEMTLSVITAPNWTTFIDNGGGVGVLQGTPTNADLGSNTVTLRVTDLSGVSIDQTFVINVDNSNDPPSFTSTPLLNIDEDDLYSYNITTEDPDDGDTRIITALSKPSWLVISDNSDGTASLTGIPTNDDVGNHSVVLEVEDAVGSTAGQSFTIAVVNVNDPPNFESLPALGALQDQLYNYDILTSDPDVTDVLSIEATTLPDWLDFNDNGDGTAIISGTPRNEDLGDHDVVLRVTDRAGAAVEQLFTITADNTNDPPSFVSTPVLEVNEDANYQYLVEVTDPDAGDVITLDILAPSPDWLNFIDNGTGSGTLSGLPSNAEVGLHEVTLQATDVTGQRTLQSFEIEVINTNDPPAITSLPPTSVDEDSNYIYNLIVADDDIVFGDMVSFDFLGSLPMWLMFDPLTTTLSGTPLNDNVGSYDIVIRVSDNVGAFVDQNFTLVVNNTNDEPFFISVPVATVKEDERYEYQIEAADVDVGEQLSISAVSIPSWLLLEDVGDGTALLSGTPLNEDVGNIEIEIQVSDGVSDVAQTFNIEVVNVNDPPFFVSMPPTKVELGAQYQYTIVGEDVDQDDVLTISASDLPSYLSFTDLGNGKAVVEGEVTDLVFNDNLIRVEARDLTGEVASQEFLLEVNTLPVLTAAEINLVEDENYNFSTEFMMNFSDQDSDQLQKIVVNQIPVNGNLFKGSVLVTDNDTIEFIDQMPADLVYIPNSDFNGSDAFAWNGFDGTSWSLTNAVFSLTVESVNDLPQLTTNGALQPLSYRLGDPAINVVNSVDNLRIVDVDSRLMSRAEIRITDNASPGDRIFLNEQYQNDNIDVSYDVESATLLIVGEDLVNEYETILSNVLFSSPIDNEATVLTKQISLAVNDSLSSSNVLIRDIVIEEIFPELDIVNSFTPNGDGVNDTWDILNLQFYAKIRIEIFESGGARVFSCSSSDCQWDGFSNGKELPAGSYLYLIDLDDGRREYNGVVNILR
ncbi:MAG: putative Ig domain-containing protein, partial [Bacteroidota bacterium]